MTTQQPQPGRRPTPGPRDRRPAGAVRRADTRAALVAVVLVCLAGASWLVRSAVVGDPGALTDMDGRQVVLEHAPDATGAQAAPTGGHFVAPEQGLDVPLLAMTVTGQVVNPPSLVDAYLLRGYGSPTDPGSGLVVVAMHAVRDGHAPGNAFVDPDEGAQVSLDAGDPLVVDGVAYAVDGVEVLGKDRAAQSLWDDAPARDGELLVLTCLQRPGTAGAAAENLVVHATRTTRAGA
ncbi:hypothetical protein [Isoptericola sp. NPDC057653]|uniref:hypothetical protein n=1 Tax=unclassified Isoptericola TaxID=2623355 RepID=UPI0036B4113B